jgi:predicted enzyme related to lactoylglutathione lyase
LARTQSYASKTGVAIQLTGFDSLLNKIKKAGGNIEAATWDAARAGGRVYYETLIAECRRSGVPEHLINKIRFNCLRDSSGNRFAVVVGWYMDEYDPANPADGYKVVFLNYGTPRRESSKGDRGYITGRGFIGRAKKKAHRPIKQAQENFLKKILDGLA